MREGYLKKENNEMSLRVYLNLDRERNKTIILPEDKELLATTYLKWDSDIESGGWIRHLPHWIEQFSIQGHVDLRLHVVGGLDHDVYEAAADGIGDVGRIALGDKKGIVRSGYSIWNMEGQRAVLSMDCSGRPFYKFRTMIKDRKLDEMVQHFFNNLAYHLGADLEGEVEVTDESRENDHHKAEAMFKACAQAFDKLKMIHPLSTNQVPSTKGNMV